MTFVKLLEVATKNNMTMAKPKDSVEIRLFVTPEQRNEIKSVAAANGMTITEYFLQLYNAQKSTSIAA